MASKTPTNPRITRQGVVNAYFDARAQTGQSCKYDVKELKKHIQHAQGLEEAEVKGVSVKRLYNSWVKKARGIGCKSFPQVSLRFSSSRA